MVLNKDNNMINLNTPEAQAAREQFKQKVEEQKLALQNSPPKLAKSEKERPTEK
jgi:hypothetical protein